VLLTGDGGDEALSWGHLRVASVRSLIRERHLLPAARGIVRRCTELLSGHRREPGSYGVELVSPQLAADLDLAARSRELTDRINASSPRELHALRIELSSRTGSREAQVAHAAPHGLNIRSPFLDRRVLEFCLALPTNQKEGRGPPRAVLRRAMEGLLPPEVLWRGKWAAKTVTTEALRRIRARSRLVPGVEGPLSGFLDPLAVQAAWSALDGPHIPADAFAATWMLAALDVQIRSNGLI
jgi:asparagine synthetase B (glutamine-hydrolysing)